MGGNFWREIPTTFSRYPDPKTERESKTHQGNQEIGARKNPPNQGISIGNDIQIYR